MARNIQFKRGTKAKNDTFIGPDGSLSIDKESKTLRVHNGATAGGAFTILDANAIGSYGKYAKLITDWNDANENGVFMGDRTCAHAPESGFWSMGHVENHGAAGWCTQFVHCFTDDVPTNTRTYRRDLNNGVWSSNWERVLLTEQEQKLIFLPLTGGALTGNLTLVGDPTADLHPATKRWVESLSGKKSVRVATADVLGGAAYDTQTITARTTLAATGTTTSGSTSISAVSRAIYYIKVGATISGSGIPAGATVTAVASSTITISAAATTTGTGVALTITNPLSALVVDGVTLAVGNRVLVKNESASNNGLYALTTLGTASIPWVLTRTTDADAWDDLPGATVYVEDGLVNAETSWKFTVKKGGTLGSTSITVVDESTVETKTIGDNSKYIANTEYVSNYIGSWLVIIPPAAGGDLVASLQSASASALSISGATSNDVNLIFDDSIPSNINYRSRVIFNNTSKNLVVKNLTGPTVTIAKNARVTVYSNGSGFFRTEEDNELIYGNQLSGYVVTGNLEFSGTGIGKQSVRQWVSATSDAGYKTISLPVSCIPHSITGVTTDPENATAYSLKITYTKDGSLQSSFRAAVVNSSNAYVSGIRFNISVEGSM